MKKIKKIFKNLFTIIIYTVLVFGAGYLFNEIHDSNGTYIQDDFDLKLPWESTKRVVTLNEVDMKLLEIKEFVSYSAEYDTKYNVEETRALFKKFDIPFTTNSIYIEGTGFVKVGYNVDEIVKTVDDENQKIYITLPEQTIINYLDFDTVSHDEKNNVLNPINLDQYMLMIKEIEHQGLENAINDGIESKAEANIKQFITNYLETYFEYEVIFN